MKVLVRHFLPLFFVAAAVSVSAQVAGPSPLTDDLAAKQLVPGARLIDEQRADQALRNGFPATAAGIYRELIADPVTPAEVKARVGLPLVTALLDAGQLPAAEEALSLYTGPHNSAYQLRAGLLAIANRRLSAAKAALAAGRVEDLTPEDQGWWYFLQASVDDVEGNITQANQLFEQATRTAVSDLQQARFVLGREQSRLGRSTQATEAQLATLRGNMERFQGQSTGYDFTRAYAVALAGSGRVADAKEVLRRQLNATPSSERNNADQLRLTFGLIAGETSDEGRRAFLQLVQEGQRLETRRIALQLLVRGASTPLDRDRLRRDLTAMIGGVAQNPVMEDLLLARAQIALQDKNYAPSEVDARALLERYPNTPLRESALGVLLSVTWDLKRYRTAADVIAQLRTMLPPGKKKSELGVLLAEAFFRAQDFRNAADAYEASLREPPPLPVPAGTLIFQRVLSEILAKRLDAAARQLDEAANEPGFDVVSRWQAEWNLVKELQVLGQVQPAYDRVERLLAGSDAGVPEDLRIRLLWLRAKLSFDNSQPERALRQADELLVALTSSTALEGDLRTDVTSTTQLLKAQSLLELGRDAEGVAMLEKLRADFRSRPAALSSFLVQAGYLSQRGDLAGAQRVLISFADQYKESEYATLALYQAAVLLERQGLDRQLEEANKLLERIVVEYPRDNLVFYARLKQGDLMRKLNYFPQARQLYEYLVNNYPSHPDELLAELGLAYCLFAQGSNSEANYESASARFERLRDLPSADIDLRVEAGFMWGYGLAKRGQTAKAQAVLWSVVQSFLLDENQAPKLRAQGRRWIARALFEFGQIHEDAGRMDEAQRAYQLVIDNRLSGTALAQSKLARFRPTGSVPGATP